MFDPATLNVLYSLRAPRLIVAIGCDPIDASQSHGSPTRPQTVVFPPAGQRSRAERRYDGLDHVKVAADIVAPTSGPTTFFEASYAPLGGLVRSERFASVWPNARTIDARTIEAVTIDEIVARESPTPAPLWLCLNVLGAEELLHGGGVALAAADVIGIGPLGSVSSDDSDGSIIEDRLKNAGFAPVWRGRNEGDPSWRGLFARDWPTVARDLSEREAAASIEAFDRRRAEAGRTEALRNEIDDLKDQLVAAQTVAASAEQHIETLRAELERERTKLVMASADLDDLRRQYADRVKAIAERDKAISAIRSRILPIVSRDEH